MNVVALTDYLNNIGGAELSARRIVEGVASHSAVDQVVVIGVDRSDEAQLDYGPATVDAVGLPAVADELPDFATDLLVERLLARRARNHLDAGDVVHAHHRRSSLALAHLPDDVPTVTTVRDFWPVCPISVYSVDCEQCTGCEDRLDDCVAYQGWDGLQGRAAKPYLLTKRRHNRRGFDATDSAVFIADHLRATVMSAAAAEPATGVIPNPVAVEAEIDPAPAPSSPTFVTASSLVREKGIAVAIDAIARVAESYPDATLRVFGDGPLRGLLEGQAAERCERGTVIFEGRVAPETVHKAMAEATATVFPSRWAEPFGRVTVESLVVGTPVVGSEVGGIAEVIADGETGLLVNPGDPEALASAMTTVHETPAFRERVAEWQATARQQFTAESVADKYVEQFRSLLA